MPAKRYGDIELIRSKLHLIGEEIWSGLGKVAQRFVEEMLSGMLASRSVRLTSIAAALEEPIPLHATHKHLSRNLCQPRIGRVFAGNLLTTASRFVRDEVPLLVDLFELVKP
ncbi:MAG: hypothetical protein OXH09_03460 [Gammaproteobacteria bacterium]|nr:hypothetical protein [Gammaproteobacteria bacterium]